jgi:hypothetical protein
MTLRPWIGYITLVDVEYDDTEIVVPTDEYGGILRMIGTSDALKVKQGIAAGIVRATGEGVPALDAGTKIYYAKNSAIQIGNEKLVHGNYVVGYEELG